MPKLIKRLLPIGLLLIAVGIFVVLVKTRPQAPVEAPEEEVWTVSAVEVQPQARAPVVDLHGRLGSPSSVVLTAPIVAEVAVVPAREGQTVAEGALLVRLQADELEILRRQRAAQLREIEAQIGLERQKLGFDKESLQHEQQLLELAQREVARLQDLAGKGMVSQAQLDTARQAEQRQALSLTARRQAVASFELRLESLTARREQAAAALAEVEDDLAEAEVRAPFAARVSEVRTAPGARVRPGEPLLALYSLERLEVRAQLPNRVLPLVRAALAEGRALPARAEVDGAEFALDLQRLAGSAGAGEAGVAAIFDVTTPPPTAVLGRFLTVRLQLPPLEQTVAVPFDAVYGLDRVYEIVDGRMQAVQVERLGQTLVEGEPRALVRSPELQAGDRVVATQIPRAMQGLKVREAQ